MVDISYLFVDITQLHVAFVHLVIVYHLVYFLDPLVIHKHAVVTLSYHFLPSDEFVILRFHTISHRLDYWTLLEKRLIDAKSWQYFL